jgi:hypothetical protein
METIGDGGWIDKRRYNTNIEKGMVAIHFISGEKGPTARGYGN